jgi:hypothetical protein
MTLGEALNHYKMVSTHIYGKGELSCTSQERKNGSLAHFDEIEFGRYNG